MKCPDRLVLTVSLVLLVWGAAGCADGGGTAVTITHVARRESPLPRGIRKLAVAPFAAKGGTAKKWGEFASRTLAAELVRYGSRHKRYGVVSPDRVASVAKQGLSASISGTAAAVRAGLAAGADAVIFGTVDVVGRTRRPTTGPSAASASRRFRATVTFSIAEVATGATLAAISVTRQHDSAGVKLSGSPSAAATAPAGKAFDVDATVRRLIAECVEEFLGRNIVEQAELAERLRPGRSRIVAAGNLLAKEGVHDEALDCYLAAVADEGDDHGAMFNAGVMCEILGRFEQAERWYSRAIRVSCEHDYVQARGRVRRWRGR